MTKGPKSSGQVLDAAKRVLWITLAIISVVAVIVVVLEVQVYSRNKDIHRVRNAVTVLQTSSDKTRAAAESAQTAASEADKTLQAALKASHTTSIDSKAVLAGLQTIQQIELQLAELLKKQGVGGP